MLCDKGVRTKEELGAMSKTEILELYQACGKTHLFSGFAVQCCRKARGAAARLAAAERATGSRGSVATQNYRNTVALRSLSLVSFEETMDRFKLSVLEMADEDGAAPPEIFHKVEARFSASGRCTLCNKEATDGHRAAAEHRKRVQETCQLEGVLGEVDCPRRFGLHGAVGCDTLTKKALKAYWGPKIGELASYLQRKMERGASLKYKYSESKPAMNVTTDQVQMLETVIVRYGSQKGGKYHLRDQCLSWGDVPEDQVGGGTLSGSASSDSLAADRGWWPAVRVQMVDGRLHTGVRNDRDVVVIILVCLYQALMDEPAAWPLFEDVEEPDDLATQDFTILTGLWAPGPES